MKFNFSKKKALYFILFWSCVSFFTDISIEGTRSVFGPYFLLLGASGVVVASASGFGELVGYVARLPFGYLADRYGAYWLCAFLGYTINFLVIPLFAFVHTWQQAVILVVIERFGKALRTPSRDALLSFAAEKLGPGFGFGLHELFDQIGALLGPIVMSIVLLKGYGFQQGFLILAAFAFISLMMLLWTAQGFRQGKETKNSAIEISKLGKTFWLYIIAVSLIACGYIDFPLFTYYFQKNELLPLAVLPLLYSSALLFEAMSALFLGRLYDRFGATVILFSAAISAFFPFFVFQKNLSFILIGVVLWGFGLGAQKSVMRSFIVNIVPGGKRGTAYGILNTSYGIFWFIGSAIMGLLFERNLMACIWFSFLFQFASLPIFMCLRKR